MTDDIDNEPVTPKRKRYKHKKGWYSHLYVLIKNDYSKGESWEKCEYLLQRMSSAHKGSWTGSGFFLDTNFRDMSFLFKDRKMMFKFLYNPMVKKRIKTEKTEIFDVNPYW